MNTNPHQNQTIFLTGATGYVGGRVAPLLLKQGYHLRCAVRSREKLLARNFANDPRVEIIEVDMLDTDQLTDAMVGCDIAYYLIHSMQVAGKRFADHDRNLASSFADAAGRSGLKRVIYLGGLGELGDGLSEHLQSRREVEQILATGPVSATIFRAAMIIGSGSASFEMLRYLVERLPVMITPKWLKTKNQPIAIRNVLHYLTACLDHDETIGKAFDIGGPDVLTYHQLIESMAGALGVRKRFVIRVPVLTPRLSSAWVHLVTPISYRMARPLAEGLRNEVVCRENTAMGAMPQDLLPVNQAIELALAREQSGQVQTDWSDAGVIPGDPNWAGGTVFRDIRHIEIDATREEVFTSLCRICARQKRYPFHWLWHIRGLMDRIAGGPGLRKPARLPENLTYGDALDFWRVVDIERPNKLALAAEMKLPGKAHLEFEVTYDEKNHHSKLKQSAIFKPRGLLGLAYWYSVVLLHHIIFSSMLNAIKRDAQKTHVQVVQPLP